MFQFLQMAPPPIWPFLHTQYDTQLLSLLRSADTGSRNAHRARALVAAVALRGPDTRKSGIKPVPRKPPAGEAVLFKSFRYWYQLRNLRHFFAPQLQGSLLLASSMGNL